MPAGKSGAEKGMLINCVVYEDGRKLAEPDLHEIDTYLSRPGCFVWVALRDPSAAELELVQEEFGLHPLAVEDARHGNQRPKIEEYGDSLFVVLHTVETAGDEVKSGEIDIFVGRNYVLSVRNRTERGFEDVRARAEREPELLRNGSGFVLYALMDAVVDRYFPVLEAVESEVERVEDRLFSGRTPRENIEALYYVKQKLTALKHATAPLLETTGKLFGGRVPSACAGLGEYFRDVYDHLVRISEESMLFQDRVSSLLDAHLASVSNQLNAVMKVMTIISTIFLPLTVLTGLYGMNVGLPHLPGGDRAQFWWVLGIMLVLSGSILYVFRRQRWI